MRYRKVHFGFNMPFILLTIFKLVFPLVMGYGQSLSDTNSLLEK